MTTVTLRPVATLQSRLAIVHGSAATIDAATADDDDTTFVRQTATTGFAKVQFAGFDLPQGAVVVSVVITLRMSAPAPMNVSVALNAGTPVAFAPTFAVFTDYGSAAQGGFSAQSVENGISAKWTVDNPVDISEAYLDVTYVERPVVEINTPAGTVTTSQPEIDWTFLAALAQSNYQVKLFSTDQYEAPGFQPTDSEAFFDSGIQAGTADSFTPTSVNLVNGQSYREYVRAAQLVNGAQQWSAWEFILVTLNAPVPATPFLTVTPDDENARIKLSLSDTFTAPAAGGYGSGLYGAGPYGGGETAAAFTGAAGPGTWQFVTVQRTSDGGVTWDQVRSATRAQVFGDTFVVYDYESCNEADVQYRAQATAVVGAGDVASDWSTTSAPAHWSSPFTWLKSPTNPAINAAVRINSLPTLTRRRPQTVLDVEGRDDPVVVSDTRKLVTGTVTFVTLEGAERDAINVLLADDTLLLQTPPEDDFGCRYIAIGDTDENRIVNRSNQVERLIVCPFNEVTAPVGDIIGIGATWALVLARYATWGDLEAANVSWATLLELTA